MSNVKLSKELVTHKGPLKEIELREPKLRSFRKHGEPFKTRVVGRGDDARVEFDYNNEAMSGFLSDMTGVDAIILDDLTAPDYMELRTKATYMILGLAGNENPTVTSPAQA